MVNTQLKEQLLKLIEPALEPIGFEVVELELIRSKQKKLKVYIDHLGKKSENVGIEDCVQATRVIDPVLDQSGEVEQIFHGSYELEVSSPGINRPLTREKDFQRFQGQRCRVHLFRSLNEEEIANPQYFDKNSKQKNFLGCIEGLENQSLILSVPEVIRIPTHLISKAHLEPELGSPGTKGKMRS